MAKTTPARPARSQPPKTKPISTPPSPRPDHGERVRRSASDTEYEITYVSPDNTYVDVGIPRTNFEHRLVPVAALIFLEEPRTPPKPAKPLQHRSHRRTRGRRATR